MTQMQHETRQAYRDQMSAELDGTQASIEELKVRAEEAPPRLRDDLVRAMNGVSESSTKVREALGALEDASDEAWHDAKEGLEEAFADLREAYRRATHLLKS